MPILRGPDGQIIDDKTDQIAKSKSSGSRDDAVEPDTDPIARRRERNEESLFEPKHGAAHRSPGGPTAPKEGGGVDKTRVIRRRTRAASSSSVPELSDPMSDPPVGWLVIVGGPGQGHSFALGTGMNSIGRGDDARLRIAFGDDGISRSDHARLAYDPRRRLFHLSHGSGANLTYLNGEVVMSPMQIESGSTIEIGATTLRFQAFCSTDFDWSDVDD
ncbi:MAG: FHA domain-containing protein [Acidobacteriota bacterium]|nr:FHA domain-containing protein [Acidobacteriota bacterium]